MNLLISASIATSKEFYENHNHEDSLSETEKDSMQKELYEFLSEEFLRELQIVLDWAQWRRSSTTWGDVLALKADLGSTPDDVALAWERLSTIEFQGLIRGKTSGLDAARVIRDILHDMDERERHIFIARTLQFPENTPEVPRKKRETDISPSLEELGVLYGVSRERVRQIQQKTERNLRRMLSYEHSVRWLSLDIPEMLGVAFPLDMLVMVPALAVLAMTDDENELNPEVVRRTMVWFSGFEVTRRDFGLNEGGWALRDGMDPDRLRGKLVEQAPDSGLRETDIESLLMVSGVVPQVINVLVGESLPGMKRFDGVFLPWQGAIVDKAETILRWLDRPATDNEILSFLDGYVSETSARNLRTKLLNDSRFMKVAKATFALREWDANGRDAPA